MNPTVNDHLTFDGRLTVVEAASADRRWADGVLAERPGTQLHWLPRGGAGALALAQLGSMLSLDRALAALGVRHVNYLRIADAAVAIPILLGAGRLLRHARIDIIEIAGDPAADQPAATIRALLEPFDFMPLQPYAPHNPLLLAPPGGAGGGPALFMLHRRFASAVAGADREPDLGALLAAHRLTPRGIIHV